MLKPEKRKIAQRNRHLSVLAETADKIRKAMAPVPQPEKRTIAQPNHHFPVLAGTVAKIMKSRTLLPSNKNTKLHTEIVTYLFWQKRLPKSGKAGAPLPKPQKLKVAKRNRHVSIVVDTAANIRKLVSNCAETRKKASP